MTTEQQTTSAKSFFSDMHCRPAPYRHDLFLLCREKNVNVRCSQLGCLTVLIQLPSAESEMFFCHFALNVDESRTGGMNVPVGVIWICFLHIVL